MRVANVMLVVAAAVACADARAGDEQPVVVKPKKRIDGPNARIVDCVWHPTRDLVLTVGQHDTAGRLEGALIEWDTKTWIGRPFKVHGPLAQAVAVSPDGRWSATAGMDNRFTLTDLVKGQEHHSPVVHRFSPMQLAFSPDGKWLVSADCQGTIVVFDMAAWKVRRVLAAGDVRAGRTQVKIFHLAFVGTTELVAGGMIFDGKAPPVGVVQTWDVATGELASDERADGLVTAALPDPKGRWIIRGSGEGIGLVPLAPFQFGGTGPGKLDPFRASEVTRGGKQYVANVQFVKPLPDGRLLVAQTLASLAGVADGVFTGRLVIVDPLTGKVTVEFVDGIDKIISCCFSPDGNRMVSVGFGGEMYLWDVPSPTGGSAK